MARLSKISDYRYIVEDRDRKRVYLKSLGKVSDEEALLHLAEWKRRADIQPIYRTIVIDPPWPMEKIQREVRPNQMEMDYKTMSLDEIKEFPLQKFMHEDGCHVYLWTTHKFLRDALGCMDAWGVNYQCLMTWVKNVGFTPFSWMYSTEHVLFGTRGNMPLLRKGIRLDFCAGVREHSRKPDEFYDIVRRVSPYRRIDIFSQEKREEFDHWGDQDDEL